jgi:predicted O-methyltransferase YrrM
VSAAGAGGGGAGVSEPAWEAVDAYVQDMLLEPDDALEAAVRTSVAAGLPAIAVSPPQGKMLHLLARLHHARRILELGTLGGYSTIWLARALPAGGELLTLELDPHYAEVAAENITRAGVDERVQIRIGPALEGLQTLVAEGGAPFDLVFIDADKPGTPAYFEHALKLTRPGGLIVTDNVVRGGALADAGGEDPGPQGMRRFHELLALAREDGSVSATTIQTVGVKGYDGFTLALVAE